MKTQYQQIIENHINDYISTIDFKSPLLDLNEVKREIAKLTNTIPSIKIKWDTKTKVNELKKAAGVEDYIEKIETPQEMTITLIDDNEQPFQLKYIL